MSTQIFELGTAALFLLLAVVGGGISVKEISVPRISAVARVALAVLGIGVGALGVLTNPPGVAERASPAAGPSAGAGDGSGVDVNRPSSGTLPPCRHPGVGPRAADGTHSEADARRILTDSGLLEVITAPAFEPNAPKGLVVGIDPPPGTVRCPRAPVTIKVTR